ncbi:MAG: hypothetical protein LBB10_00870 [Bifidobacteriaceae bacterium]|nr:hypothetical protein [Bifidobacteriaceae bacterium]
MILVHKAISLKSILNKTKTQKESNKFIKRLNVLPSEKVNSVKGSPLSLHLECEHFLHNTAIKNEIDNYSRTFFIYDTIDKKYPCFFFSLGISVIDLSGVSKNQRGNLVKGRVGKLRSNKNMSAIIILGQFARLESKGFINSKDAYNFVLAQIEKGREIFGGNLLNIDTTEELAKSFYTDKLNLNMLENVIEASEVKKSNLKSYIVKLR